MEKVIKNWQLILVLILSLIITQATFVPGYFTHHDDLQVMRIFEMRRCFADFQIPCRWVPDMGFGNGFPLFNYYGVLPYYIGGLLSYVLGYIGAAKALFFIPLFLGGLTIYLFLKEVFGKNPALVGSVLFILAPYRAVDAYVRGDVSESFAISLAPLLFLFSYRLIKNFSKFNFLGFSLSLGIFLLCHNLMTLIFIPVLGVWSLYWLYLEKFKNFQKLFLAGILGGGIAAFYLLPVFGEQSLVQINNLTILGSDYRAHFATINQLLFSRFWGYGDSVFGPGDTLSFQVGWPHWWLSLIVLPLAIYNFKDRKKFVLSIFIFIFLWGSIFMAHERSLFVWKTFDFLKFMQFPWRFLSLATFSSALLGTLLISYLPKNKQLIFGLLIVILTIILNIFYFHPATIYPLTDQQKLSGKLFEIQQQAGILDYLPKTAQEPKSPRPDKPEVIWGKAEVSNFHDNSNNWNFSVKVEKQANIEVPVFDFPNWKVLVSNKPFVHSHNNRLGRVRLDLPPGNYRVNGMLENTPVRTLGNIISMFAIFLTLVLFVNPFKKIKLWK